MSSPHSFTESLRYFKDRRLLSIFCFGIASGFPWVLVGSAMTGWLKDEGLSRSSIGLFGLVFACYSINFLWSPLADRVKIPLLTLKLGMRRSWILVTQFIICLCTLKLSTLDASSQLNLMALFGLFIALNGATQDIAIDAFRIDTLSNGDSELMAAGSAMATAGWWTGYAGLGSIPFILVTSPNWQWSEVFLVLAAIMAILMLTALVVQEPSSQREETLNKIEQNYLKVLPHFTMRCVGILIILPLIMASVVYANIGYPSWPNNLISKDFQFSSLTLTVFILLILFIFQLTRLNRALSNHETSSQPSNSSLLVSVTAWILTTLVAPIQEFFTRNGARLAISILMFIFLFKLGEAYLGRMSIVFYREVGFSNEDIAYYSKLINWATTIVFSLIGSVFTIRYGILKGLFIGGIAMSASNLLFSVIAIVGPSKPLFALTVFVDGFTSAWGSVAFVALLSVLCNKSFTASQYALMASLGTFGRVMLGSYSGIIVDWLDGNWALFFILTSLMVIPSLLFLYSIRKPLTALIEQNNRQSSS
ncbi:AmpG family muropeptide MFS transporter [Thalassotalea sp. M1531]|uniref:AmpG family muropeptide MFS transporter n=1 Tax=Thalassotalea algicola TaxID=2716224 RepID=A0A7Y0Q773_9GAMM|nr:MFS transporter permease [Thalassotalea algicola]NMP32178.1 AmpG family muropeptide MFS transporter [Thalassotalea algicola]